MNGSCLSVQSLISVFPFFFQDKSTGQAILDVVFRHLNLLETAYFGLRYLDQDGQTVSDLHKTKSDVHLCVICMCTALVGPRKETEQTAQGRRAIHTLLWC